MQVHPVCGVHCEIEPGCGQAGAGELQLPAPCPVSRPPSAIHPAAMPSTNAPMIAARNGLRIRIIHGIVGGCADSYDPPDHSTGTVESENRL